MRAFITKLDCFFKLNTQKPDDEKNFKEDRRTLKIPMYQREYKWENDKIGTLIVDISKKSKFLGNIILDETTECYEIADGQQRITTCYLILVYLYNYYQGSQLEQKSILNIIKPGNKFILKNDTVGSYLQESDGRIVLSISEAKDIYYQKDDFERAYKEIAYALEFLKTDEQVRDFKDKLLKSEILVLINDEDPSTPIEQIFLDINEKAQLLDIEDIFKGHCFEIFDPMLYGELRNTWVKLKTCASGFSKLGVKTLSDYIYLFLLEDDRTDLPQKLNPNGRHYLEGKTMDQTNDLLQKMIRFGESVLQFASNLSDTQYRFTDICPDSARYRNTSDHLMLKAMCASILAQCRPLYQELPFWYFIYEMTVDDALKQEISHDYLRRIITNLYVYASLFSLSSHKKSKDVIDHSVRDAAKGTGDCVKNMMCATKELRRSMVEGYEPNPKAKFNELAMVYSITDNYQSNENWISQIYSRDANYNLEHFIIPDQRAGRVKWYVNGTQPFDIIIDSGFAKEHKSKTCNLLVIDCALNESMENDDIIKKIETIQEWYRTRNLPIPCHIGVFLSAIQEMPEYQQLQQYKANNEKSSTVQQAYQEFLQAYFNEEKETKILSKLKEKMDDAFRN